MRERFEPASGVNLEAAIREIVRQEIEMALARLETDRRADEDRWFDVKAAAAYLSCPVERLYANHSPDLPRVKWGGRVFFRKSDLDQFMEGGRTNVRG